MDKPTQRASPPAAPAEATSLYFVAHLGETTPEVEARFLQWAACCVEHRFVRDDRNCVALYFARPESRTVRQMQSLLRTLSARWKVPLGKLGPGWCQLLTAEEFRARVPAAEPVAHAADAMPGGLEEEGCHATPRVNAPPCGMQLMRLSHGFDRRSHELLAAMRAQVVQTAP